MGMTDMQFKDFLRGIIDDLKEAKTAGVSEEAEAKIEKLIKRFEAALED